METPSNCTSLLRQLESENKLIGAITDLDFSRSDAIKVLGHRALFAAQVTRPDSVAEGLVDASDRIEEGDVIRWINDLEKDEQYKGRFWSPHMRTLLTPLGRVARNYLNGILVIDLSNKEAIEMLTTNVRAFIERGIPVRWGVVPYTNSLNYDSKSVLRCCSNSCRVRFNGCKTVL